MSLWSGEVLEKGLDDTHTDVFARLDCELRPGIALGTVPGLQKDVALAGTKLVQGVDSTVIHGAEELSRAITLQPCGNQAHRARFGVALSASRRLSPSVEGAVLLRVSKDASHTAAWIKLTSNKQRLLLTVRAVTVCGILQDCPFEGTQHSTCTQLGRPRALQGAGRFLIKPLPAPVEPALWVKVIPDTTAAAKKLPSFLKFRKFAVIGALAQEGFGVAHGKGEGGTGSEAGLLGVKVLGLRTMTRGFLGKMQSLPFSAEFLPLPAEQAVKLASGASAAVQGEEPRILPLLTLNELICAFGEISLFLSEGGFGVRWEALVLAAVIRVQAMARGRRARLRVNAMRVRKTRVRSMNAGVSPSKALQQGLGSLLDPSSPRTKPARSPSEGGAGEQDAGR